MIDERTTNLTLPLPHPDNWIDQDVARLRRAFGLLDYHLSMNAFIDGLNAGLAQGGTGGVIIGDPTATPEQIEGSLEEGYQAGLNS